MNEITMNKADLVKTVEANMQDHRRTFEKAVEGYRRRVIQELEAHIDRIRAGSLETVYVTFPVPKDHTRDYEVALRMLADHTEDQVKISAQEYRRLVLDDWDWKQEFVATTSRYV